MILSASLRQCQFGKDLEKIWKIRAGDLRRIMLTILSGGGINISMPLFKRFLMRFFFYSHDGFGLGHTRRHLVIAKALTGLNPQASALLATGRDEVLQAELAGRLCPHKNSDRGPAKRSESLYE